MQTQPMMSQNTQKVDERNSYHAAQKDVLIQSEIIAAFHPKEKTLNCTLRENITAMVAQRAAENNMSIEEFANGIPANGNAE